MKTFHGTATARLDADPDTVFATIVDVEHLPEWNRAIEAVVARPPVLEQDATWTVTMHPPRTPRWGSISRVECLDGGDRRFTYETRNADGNPSYTTWTWHVVSCDSGAEVTVNWDCHLETLDRRLLAGPIRKRALDREVPKSLASLAAHVAAAKGLRGGADGVDDRPVGPVG